MRTRAFTACLLVLAGVVSGVIPADTPAKAGEVVTLAVPSYVPVDGTLDRIVATASQSATPTDRSCGAFNLNAVVIDHSKGVAGLVTGLLSSTPAPPGPMENSYVFTGLCYLLDGSEYRLYQEIGTQGRLW